MNDPQVAKYVEALEHPHLRKDAASTLVKIGIPSVPALIVALKDEDKDVCRSAVWALGDIGDSAAVPALIAALKDEGVRVPATYALGEIGDATAVPALIETLKDEDQAVRRVAADALGMIGNAKTLPRKILAASQFSAQERIELLDALRHVCGYQFPHTTTLCQIILNEGDPDVSACAHAILDLLILVRPSQRDVASEPQQLLRALQASTPDAQPETLLRGADEPEEDDRQPVPRRTLRQRYFRNRNDEIRPS